MMSKNWKITVVPAGMWRRANEPYHKTEQGRIHVYPRSFEACRFVVADTPLANNDHMSFIGWNPSWIRIVGIWIRAYRPNSEDEEKARAIAEKMVELLDEQLADSAVVGFPKITYLGLEVLD